MVALTAVRGADGRLIVNTTNLDNTNISGLGTATGSASYSLGVTSGSSNSTVLNVGQTQDTNSLVFVAADTTDSYQFYGKNIDATFSADPSESYNVEWNASNSKFDSSGTTSGVVFQAGTVSSNNAIVLGKSTTNYLGGYDNIVVDSGTSNLYFGASTSKNLYQTTASSDSVGIVAGNGANVFNIGGSNGFYSGGSGNDTFVTSASSATKNMILGNDGDDTMQDFGSSTLFVGGNGNDYAGAHGKNALMYVGTSSGDTLDGSGATNSALFKSSTLTDTDGKIYSFADYLKIKGWTYQEFLANSKLDNNPYYSLIKSKISTNLG